jgi:hypothetical protein
MVGKQEESARGKDGAAAAAVLAAAVGIFVLGLVTSLAEALTDFKDWLRWDDAVGPLSGKSSLGLIAWLAVWPPLHLLLYRRDGVLLAAVIVAALLIIAGSVLMFPPLFERLEP